MSRITIISASWCKPCTHLKEELPKVAAELECDVSLFYEEYDEEIHHVDKLPTTCFTIDGLEKCRMIGTDKKRLQTFIRTCMAFDSIEAFGFED